MTERLQKFLASAGIGSRRGCEQLIKDGKVIVNGKVAELGTTVSEKDIVEFDNSDPDNPVQTGIKPTSMKTTELIKLYNIDAYPTIKLKKDDIVVDFDAKITQVALSKFVNSV